MKCDSSFSLSVSRLVSDSISFWPMIIVGVFVIPLVVALSFPLRVEMSMISMGSPLFSQ